MTQKSRTWEHAQDADAIALTGIRAYGLAALCVGLAFSLRWALNPLWAGRLPFGLFLMATIVATQFTEVVPSLLALVAGFFLAVWFFIPQRHGLMPQNEIDQVNAVCYFIFGVGMVWFSARVRRVLMRERTARATLSRLTAIIESSDDAIIGKSLTGKISSWNTGAAKLYGYTEAEAVGRQIAFLAEPKDEKEVAALVARAAGGEHISQFETVRRKKDGGLVEVSLSVSPMRNSAGEIVGVSSIARNISERKRAERERECLVNKLRQEVAEREAAQRALQQSQELTLRQERLAAVGRLASGLAHEFNNILTVIQGHASLLLDNPQMDEDSVKSINHITEGVERTAALVKQMLAFSRQQIMQKKVVQIKEATHQVADMLGRLLGAHVVLRLDIAPQLPAIMADPVMLQQIIVNLTVNARDAMIDGGQLTIRAVDLTFTAHDLSGKPDRRAGHFVQFSVTDTGSGIEPENIAHLFEPFFTTKAVGKGTGLGLATVHGMVNQNAGWIEVDSKVGQGTTFNLFFPVAENAPKALSEQGPPEGRGRGETILVVEDETVLRDLVREILESKGYRVLAAASGREAMQVWDTDGPSVKLVLTDMSMPDGMSGRDLATKLQERNPRLPVIFSSGYSQETLVQAAQTLPSHAFLSKPYHPTDLAQAVRASLDHAARAEAGIVSTPA